MNHSTSFSDHGTESCRTGFTLIELLSVVIIMAMLIAAAVPAINRTSLNFYFRNKAMQIEMLFSTLQKTAVMEETAYKLLFDYSSNKLTLWEAQQNQDEEFRLSHDLLLNIVARRQGIEIAPAGGDTSNGSIVFFPDGKITPSLLRISDDHNNGALLQTTFSGEITLVFDEKNR